MDWEGGRADRRKMMLKMVEGESDTAAGGGRRLLISRSSDGCSSLVHHGCARWRASERERERAWAARMQAQLRTTKHVQPAAGLDHTHTLSLSIGPDEYVYAFLCSVGVSVWNLRAVIFVSISKATSEQVANMLLIKTLTAVCRCWKSPLPAWSHTPNL